MSPGAHWTGISSNQYIFLTGSLLLAALFLSLRALLADPDGSAKSHDWKWGWMILAILAAGRWPSILYFRELNPDESLYLAGAHTLFRDPVPWGSVDSTTSGPLNLLVLWPAGLALGWTNYLGPRLMALALLVIGLLFTHQCLALTVGRAAARLVGLGTLALESLTNSFELLHFSSEILPLGLLASATYCLVRRWLQTTAPGWNFAGGLLLGAIPLAKPQAGPLGLVLGLGWLLAEFSRSRSTRTTAIFSLLTGALLPAGLVIVQLMFFGNWLDAWLSFFRSNGYYVESSIYSFDTIGATFLKESIRFDSMLHLWLFATLAGMGMLLRRPHSDGIRIRWLLLGGTVGCFVAIICILVPGRPFLHYAQLLVLPLTFLAGAIFGNFLQQPGERRRPVVMAAGLAVAMPALLLLAHRARAGNFLLERYAVNAAHRISSLSRHVLQRCHGGDTLTVWGWASFVNVESGLPLGTRDANIYQLVTPGPYQKYFRSRYLEDMRARLPAFFLDAVGPFSSGYVNPDLRHDLEFPELAEVIRSHYRQVAEQDGARLYQRIDLIATPTP